MSLDHLHLDNFGSYVRGIRNITPQVFQEWFAMVSSHLGLPSYIALTYQICLNRAAGARITGLALLGCNRDEWVVI